MKRLAFILLLWPVLAQGQVYRCGNEYTSMPCPQGGREVKLHNAAPGSRVAGMVPVYHCKSYAGGFFWSELPCNQRNATLDRTVNVPADLDWGAKLDMARRAHDRQAPVASPTAMRRVSGKRQSDGQECARIKTHLSRIETQQRAGGSAKYMESLNEQRRSLLAQQSGCR